VEVNLHPETRRKLSREGASMLETTQYKLATMYEKHPQRGSDGLMHDLDDITKISIGQGHLLLSCTRPSNRSSRLRSD
jgi:hypothetical protein